MSGSRPNLVRRAAALGAPVTITIDGRRVQARAGESLLLAVLSHAPWLRLHEVTGRPRAGFCLMGACQDCIILAEDGSRLRACTTPVQDGMAVRTVPGADHG